MFPQLISYFENKPVKRAYLFGSSARGEQTKDSDIDILVGLDDELIKFIKGVDAGQKQVTL